MIFNLQRPKPALPSSYFWTWDHSTNWMLDDPGLQNFGCANKYLKRADTFVEDYRRLTDFAAALGIPGILIWGFIRDSHGGIEASKQVASYAASKGIAIMPGFGTSHYGGAYYEGNHPYNIHTYVKTHPGSEFVFEENTSFDTGNDTTAILQTSACPSKREFKKWLHDGVRWLFDTFEIGGINIENGDFFVCNCPDCKKRHVDEIDDLIEIWKHQYYGYAPILESLTDKMADKLITYATYLGFVPGPNVKNATLDDWSSAYMFCDHPKVIEMLPKEAITQWTLTKMLLKKPLPLSSYLHDGAPAAAFDNPLWKADVMVPGPRGAGFVHQGSQWHGNSRYDLIISTIKEACLRAYRCGLEGVSIHGEVNAAHIPAALNYLAFSHFIHWPEDTLTDFAKKTLGPVLGCIKAGNDFIETLCLWDDGAIDEDRKKYIAQEYLNHKNVNNAAAINKDVESYQRYLFWLWLNSIINGRQDKHTVGFM